MKLSIIIPIFNEERFISEVIKKVRSAPLPEGMEREIIIVDDASTDNTVNILKEYHAYPDIRVIRQDSNLGKTSAIKRALKESKGNIIIIQDSDLEYDPRDYRKLIEPIIENKSSVVYGSRFMGSIRKMAFINRLANVISNATINLLYKTKITDINTCYKAFKKEVLEDIEITSKNFMFETEVTAKLLNKGYRICEVPIQYTARARKEGKKMSWARALEMYRGIIKYKYQRLK